MKKIFEEYGGVIATVIAVVCLIALVTFLMSSNGALSNAFSGIVQKFVTSSGALIDSSASGFIGEGEEDLESLYQFEYYDSLSDAISGTNGRAEKTGASVGAYTNEGRTHYVLLKNVEENAALELSGDVTINFNGKTLTCSETSGFNIAEGDVVFEASASGSKMVGAGTLINLNGGNLKINGGNYTANTNGVGTQTNPQGAIVLAAGASINLDDAKVYITDNNGGTVCCMIGATGSSITAEGCTFESAAHITMEVTGIRSLGTVKLTECNVLAKADYTGNAAGTAYASLSRGIYCEGSLELYDCYVWGAHSGITSKGELLIDGGTYEGYGHGGIYCCNAGKTVYLYNAEFNWAEMLEGYVADSVAGTNGAGMYIGGASNVTVYMDNCDVYGTLYGVVLRCSGGEENNNVYISNSKVEGSRYAFRVQKSWATTLIVHQGVGNTFSSPVIDYATNLVETGESYARN